VVLALEGALRYVSAITVILLTHYMKFVYYRIIALMLGRLQLDVDTAIKHYDDLAEEVFRVSNRKLLGDGKFKAKKLEEVIKSVVKSVNGDSESPLIEGDQPGFCRT